MLIKHLPGKDFKCSAIGLVSSHPAACLALAKKTSTFPLFLEIWANNLLGTYIPRIDLDYISRHAQQMLSSSPVSYLKSAELRGSVFQPDTQGDLVSSVFTNFPVDHQEPLEVLQKWEEDHQTKWPLGVLLEGHEFLCVVPTLKE